MNGSTAHAVDAQPECAGDLCVAKVTRADSTRYGDGDGHNVCLGCRPAREINGDLMPGDCQCECYACHIDGDDPCGCPACSDGMGEKCYCSVSEDDM